MRWPARKIKNSLPPPRLHTAIVVTGTTDSSCGGGASTFRVSQSRRRHTIKIEFIIKLNDLASSRAHSRNYHNWKRTPILLHTCLPQLVDRECAFMLCASLSWPSPLAFHPVAGLSHLPDGHLSNFVLRVTHVLRVEFAPHS